MRILRYCPELNKLTGGVTSTLVMMQLEYWFEKNAGEAFFKFLEPCEDEHYKKGLSWCEELGLSKGEFRTAFARIGKVYKSKKEFRMSQDKFEGKMYLSYFDRVKRLTFYMRNDEVVSEYLKVEKEQECTPRNEEGAPPLVLDYPLDLTRENKECLTVHIPDEVCEEIVEAYHEICEDLPKVEKVSQSLRNRMGEIWQLVGREMSQIRELFRCTQASDFLSGRIRGKRWQASLLWILQKDKMKNILGGKYARTYHREDEQEVKPKGKFHRMSNHNWDFNQLEQMEQAYIEENIKKNFNHLNPLLSRVKCDMWERE